MSDSMERGHMGSSVGAWRRMAKTYASCSYRRIPPMRRAARLSSSALWPRAPTHGGVDHTPQCLPLCACVWGHPGWRSGRADRQARGVVAADLERRMVVMIESMRKHQEVALRVLQRERSVAAGGWNS